MKRYIISASLLLLFSNCSFGQGRSAQIDTYPPQIHQQICRESTFTRYLNVLNLGDETLIFTGAFSPDTVGWATAAPLSGTIEPGDTSIIEFNFNSSGLPIDNYLADFVISSNDPLTPELVVLCMLHVQDLHIILEAEDDTVCSGCPTILNAIVFGCSEAYSFSWTSIPPGFTSTLKSPVVSPLVTTTYIVTVTDGGYSKQDSIEIAVEGPIGISENQPGSGITVYPNPGNGVFKLNCDSEYAGEGKICVTDLSGRTVHSEKVVLKSGANEMPILLEYLDPGVYIITLLPENFPRQVIDGTAKVIVK